LCRYVLVTVDARYHYLLKAFLQISTKKSKITQQEAKVIFFRRMRDEGILMHVVPGLEDEAEVAEWERRAKETRSDPGEEKRWSKSTAGLYKSNPVEKKKMEKRKWKKKES
jgi:hypothetical protein